MLTLKMISHLDKRTKIFIIVASCLLCLFIVKKVTWDNPDFLFSMAEGFDEPSMPFYILIDQAYKIYSSRDHQNLLTTFLNESENQHLIDTYIRVAGVIGDTASKSKLINLYKEFNNPTYKVRLHYIVKSIGLLGTKDAIPFLQNLLSYQGKAIVSGSTIAVSLFLITGQDHYRFFNTLGNEQKLILTDDLIRARQVMLDSKNRKRTYQEMIILDNLFRSPDYRKTFNA